MLEAQLSVLTLEDGLYRHLEKSIARAVQEADDKSRKQKPSKRSGGIPQEQLDMMLEAAELAYLNEDWGDTVRSYLELMETGADLPPFIDARLALAYACLHEAEPAFEHATKSYEIYPVDGAAYLALAKCCNLIVTIPLSGLRWLSLAASALHTPARLLKDTKIELEETAQLNEQEERYAIPFLQQDNVFERIIANPEFTSLIDVDELQVALSTVQQNMSLLKETRGRSLGLNALLKILFNDPDVLLPHISTYEETSKLVQKSCMLHQLGDEVFRKITYYLPLHDISSLQSTCKLNHQWTNDPELWKEVYCRYWEPLQPSVFGVPLLPYMWKYNFKNRFGVLSASRAVFETIKHQRADLSDIEAMRKRALNHLSRQYRSSMSPQAAGTMANQFIETIDLLATSTTPTNAIILFGNPTFLTVAVTSLTRLGLGGNVLECQSALLALLCGALAGGPQVMKSLLLLGVKTICSNLMFGQLHAEAAALLAALRLGETNFAQPMKAIMPSSFWCANFPEERIQAVTEGLNGIWRHFMFYDNLDMKDVMELGASDLKFDAETGSISGSGSDTIGSYRLLPESNFSLRTGEVTILREYLNGPVMEFTGVTHPFGMGGYFQIASTSEEEEPPVLLGFWTSHFLYKSMTDEEWKVFKADMKSKAAKRRMSKKPEAWHAEPGPVSMMSQELRALTRSTFLISLPTATYSDIYAQLENLPQISDEDLQKAGAASILRGPGETDEKFRLRETTHMTMMMILFERRAQFGLHKWQEAEHDLQALETRDVSSPAIIAKWHDYLCLYTFDNYAISNGVEALCQFFRVVLSMAQDIRASGGDPAELPNMDGTSGTGADGSNSSESKNSRTRASTESSLDHDMDRLPDKIPVDSDTESIHADEDGVDINPTLPTASLRAGHSASSAKNSKLTIEDEEDEEDEEEEDEEDSDEEDGAMKQKSRKKRSSSSQLPLIMGAAGLIAACSLTAYALARYFTRPKGKQ